MLYSQWQRKSVAITLKIAVMEYDGNPEAILVTDSRRDSLLDGTDSFRVIIDGLLDR